MVAKLIFPWAVISKYVAEDNMDPMWVKAVVAGSWVLVFPLWLGLFVMEGAISLLCVFGPFDDTVTRVGKCLFCPAPTFFWPRGLFFAPRSFFSPVTDIFSVPCVLFAPCFFFAGNVTEYKR